MSTNKETNVPEFAHLLRASPEALANMRRICAESIERDRAAQAERERQRVIRVATAETAALVARICAANERRYGKFW